MNKTEFANEIFKVINAKRSVHPETTQKIIKLINKFEGGYLKRLEKAINKTKSDAVDLHLSGNPEDWMIARAKDIIELGLIQAKHIIQNDYNNSN